MALVEASADDIDSTNPKYAGLLGNGRINAAEALPTETITGQVHLQGRSDHSGVAISTAGHATTTDDQGYFLLRLPPGSYEITASHPGYLLASKADLSLEIGAAASTGLAVLLGGDVAPEYGIIDLQDLALVAANFNNSDDVADITGDGLVDVYDLALAGRNYGQRAIPWH